MADGSPQPHRPSSLGVRLRAAAMTGLACACGEPAAPHGATGPVLDASAPVLDASAPVPNADTRPPAPRGPAPGFEPEPEPSFEPGPEPASWAFYPTVGPTLREALVTGERADVLLEELARTLAPYRWEHVDDWDNLGFIRTADDAPRGFVTRVDGALHMQPPGSYSLGCAGGFLEGLRVLLTPALEMADLQRCDEGTLAMLGPLAPAECRSEGFGLHAIANAARAAEAAGALAAPPEPLHVAPHEPGAFGPLDELGVLQLCTVSHEPTVGTRTRLYHHMMIVMRAMSPRTLLVFDTTGFRGVALRRIEARVLSRYVTDSLANNDTHRYDPASARIDCMTVARRR
jgi:hypothetical protein